MTVERRFIERVVTGMVVLVALAGVAARAEAQSYRRWYLAEGAANTFFNDAILIGNPNGTAANVTIRLLPEGQPPFEPQTLVVQPTSRATFNVNGVTGLPPGAVSAIVESDIDIVVERSMTWPGASQRGGHNSGGVLAPAGQWYLAEGVTGFFETFVLVTNTNSTSPVDVQVTFLRQNPASAPLVQTFTLPPSGRRTIYVNNDVKDALNRPIAEPFSTVVRQTGGGTTADLVVERAMYWNQFEGGHGSSAVTAPSTTWLFAEGVCGGDVSFNFQTYLLLANPGTADATATITFFRDLGGPVTKQVVVRAGRRETLFLNDLRFGAGNVAELANASFSIRVSSDQPVLAERAVYWSSNGITFIEGHNSPGVTAEAPKWAFAEGIEGIVQIGGPSHDSFFLISNANPQPLTVRATFVREDGRGVAVERTIPPQSRATILTGGIAALSHHRFSAFIESVGATPLPFVAERATYWGGGYYGGHGAPGVPWTGTIATPPAVDLTPQISSISPTHGPVTGGNDITIRGVNFTESTTVTIDGRAAQVFPVDGTTMVVTVPAGTAAGSVAVSVANSGFLPTTLPNGYAYDPVGPLLLADTILTFGDSITHGTTSFCGVAGCSVTTTGYPQRLESWLRARYPAQTAAVQRSGSPGECASASGCSGTAGRDRLPGTIGALHDLVVILEGVNDVNAGPSDSFIVDALRVMVQTAKNAGKDVILCGLLPVKPNEDTGVYPVDRNRIASMNLRLASLASAEGVPFVDMVAAFGSAFQPLLSPDGLHPNDAGYQRMAEAVGNTVVAFFAVP
jgi:lysophospholipase L1-like esterase